MEGVHAQEVLVVQEEELVEIMRTYWVALAVMDELDDVEQTAA